MKVVFLYEEGDKYQNAKRKIVGIYAWEKDEWILYTNTPLKNRILKKTELVTIGVCKETKSGIYRNSKTFTSKDFKFVQVVNEILMWDFNPSLAVGDIESLDKNSIARFKELLVLLE